MDGEKTRNPARCAVVGGGLSGLAAAWLIQADAEAAGLAVEVTVVESEDRPGGKIGTLAREGYRCEIGPNGFLDNKPSTLQLVGRMGLSDRLLRSNDSARKRYIFSGGRLQQLPEDPLSFLTSELISIRGKMRLGFEYFVPPRRKGGADETLGDFVRRRLGQEPLDKLIDPMASGIFAGDPENMSLAACFPKIVHLEETYGGLLKGMLALKRQAAAAGRQGPASAGPGGVLMSFREGLEELIGGLSSRLREPLLTATAVTALVRSDGEGGPCWRLALKGKGGETHLDADLVVLALPATDAAAILEGMDPGIAATMRTIPYAAMAVSHLGYRTADLPRPLDGFGFLIPHVEGRRILGSLWASSIFAGRAPEGHVLLTVMAGGAKDPRTPRLTEEEIIGLVREELRITMGIAAAPVFTTVISWREAIPQYTFGHPDRVASLERRLSDHPGLFLTGNAFRGVGVNDCVASGQRVAQEAVAWLGRRMAPA
jgi:oxygen-dependent protoporphyrinogen oxidase